jgi:hypothetical protein
VPAVATVAALPLPLNLLLYQGDDFAMTVNVVNGDGSPYDLTGQTAAAEIRTNPPTDPPVAVFDATVLDAPHGVIALSLPATRSELLAAPVSQDLFGGKLAPPVAMLVWDLAITSAAGAVYTLLAGSLRAVQRVTW